MRGFLFCCMIFVLFLFIIIKSETLKVISHEDISRDGLERYHTVTEYEWHWENLPLYLKRTSKRIIRKLNR
ncbi:MAG: hypothetical protein FJZ16_08005 [Candidatus Omnitrophica bacterium]|nr:hypothetical protein [Candidatus Omnitrophota bacterium]